MLFTLHEKEAKHSIFCFIWGEDFKIIIGWFFSCFAKISQILSNTPISICESESCSVLSDSLPPHGVYSPWNFPGQNTGVGSLSSLQEIFPTQGSNPGLPHCRRFFTTQVSHIAGDSLPAESQGKRKNIGVGSLSLLHILTQELNWDLLHCRWILYKLSYQGSPYLSRYLVDTNY